MERTSNLLGGTESCSATLLKEQRRCIANRRLTPPSSGRPPASFACFRPPLMSNARRQKGRPFMHHRWSLPLSLVALCQLGVAAPPNMEERTFENDRLGKVQFVVPVEWETYDRHHINFGTTV